MGSFTPTDWILIAGFVILVWSLQLVLNELRGIGRMIADIRGRVSGDYQKLEG